MAEERGFLGRWSARKRAARAAETATPPPAEAETADRELAPDAAAELPEIEPQAIDPVDLPPLESIRTGADVQAFLQRGVPKALRQAALRRLWATDPAIRDFREVADYDWDFNAPGYGALLPGDDPKAAAGRLLGTLRRRVATAAAPSAPPPAPTAIRPADAPLPASSPPAAVAAVAEPGPAAPPEPARETGPEPPPEPGTPAVRRRRHGGAMPG